MTTTDNLIAQQLRAQAAYDDRKKSGSAAWLLWLFLGGVGAHRFYMGDTGYALGMLFTAGGLGVWTLIDAFNINRRLREVNEAARRNAYGQHGLVA